MTQSAFDAIIIGSGAGGGASAWGLASHGFKCLVLEAGPFYSPSEYQLAKESWEQNDFPDRAIHRGSYSFGRMQRLRPELKDLRSWNHQTGLTNNTDYRAAGKYHHMRGVGGSTLIYSAEAHRLHPDSMMMRSRFGVSGDWPLSYSELEPYYCSAERIIGVSGPPGHSVRFRSESYPLPPHRLSYASTKIKEGCIKLGLTLESNPVAILSRPYDGRPQCNYCANCYRGCQMTDKGSVDVTFIRKAIETGRCVVRDDCRVTRLEAGDADRITRVEYMNSDGKFHAVSGRVIVLCCGAIETPRLLLTSKNNYAPDGVGNESGAVGRNFMETIYWYSSATHSEPLGSHRGIPVDSVCWDFNGADSIPGVIGGCRFSASVAEADLVGPINYAKRVATGWGKAHKAAMRRLFGKALVIVAMGEALPNKYSYIELNSQEKDDAGIPIARINTFIDDMDISRLKFMSKTAKEILIASGATGIFEEFSAYDTFNSSHVFGTCRMGSSPEDSVVDRYLRSHRWKNLFIADSSVFPSSGGGEAPSLTIEALAIRTANHIARLAKKAEL
ncbi:MAG: GMC family oxidoreductase [Candidatus Magnetominusculus sp. LBB02]|nr:GMC family oxidoreductase [Candidatus Magnetominusculus sp. LBB02]